MKRHATVLILLAVCLSWAYAESSPDPKLFGAFAKATDRPALYFSTREEFKPHGLIQVLVRAGTAWELAGEVEEDQHLRDRIVDLSRWGTTGDIAVKLAIKAPGAAHLDALLVAGKPAVGLDARLSRKLASADNDVVSFSEVADTIFVFKGVSKPTLSMTARIEAAVIGKEPVLYPTANTYTKVSRNFSFYHYRLGSHPWSPTVDGSLRDERLGELLFKETFPLGSGHPESPTYGWVGDNGRFLFAALDFTADNTQDGPVDYGTMHVRTAAGVREFKVTTAQERWGKSGFEYTDRVGWEHMVYELAIPLKEIGARPGDELDIAFAAYGTAAAWINFEGSGANGVDPDSGPSGTTFTFIVKYVDFYLVSSAPLRSDVWIDLNGDTLEGSAGPVAPLGGGPPAWMLALLVVFGGALAAGLMRKRLARVALVLVASAALWSCPPPPAAQTTQEVYHMTGSGNWETGVVMTVTVNLVRSPGIYNFEFLFKDDSGSTSIAGAATGQHTLTIN